MNYGVTPCTGLGGCRDYTCDGSPSSGGEEQGLETILGGTITLG